MMIVDRAHAFCLLLDSHNGDLFAAMESLWCIEDDFNCTAHCGVYDQRIEIRAADDYQSYTLSSDLDEQTLTRYVADCYNQYKDRLGMNTEKTS